MESQYRSILKATSIFGGTQFLQILVGLVRSKFVALLIGTTGMGMNSMYMSSLTIFITIFGMGVNMSVVKDLSKAYNQQDYERYAKIIITFRHLCLILGILGTLSVILFSPLLSQLAFTNKDYTVHFIFLSIIVFFTIYTQGNTALLISSRRIKDTALCSLISSIVSLVIAVPFFYFMRLDGIVPGIVFSTIGNYFVTYIYARKLKIQPVQLSKDEQFLMAKGFVTLGLAMVTTSLLGNLTNYLINISISNLGDLSDVGLYSAGFNITMQSVMMIFASMASDYFPRLSAAMDDKDSMNQTMNEQSEILLLLAVPILSIFMILSPIVVRLLLSEQFLPVTSFIRILCLGMLIKTASYALGYASFAKGDKKVYLLLEGLYSNLAYLVLSVVFYYFWGLQGLAWSFVVNYFVYYLIVKFVDQRRYGYQRSKPLSFLLRLSLFLMTGLLLLSFSPTIIYYPIAGVVILVITIYYLKILNQKTNLISSFVLKFRQR